MEEDSTKNKKQRRNKLKVAGYILIFFVIKRGKKQTNKQRWEPRSGFKKKKNNRVT